MADYTTLEFCGTVAFLLEGIPHHVVGAWHPSKKCAQRDTAERALGFFVGRGEQVQRRENIAPVQAKCIASAVEALEQFCHACPDCDSESPHWELCRQDTEVSARVGLQLLGVAHTFAGMPKLTEEKARDDAARRVLWYLGCPGFEDAFSPDWRAPAVTGRDIPPPPASWAKKTNDVAQSRAVQVAERKTALMRAQNRLQQAFARSLQPGQSVWEWKYDLDEEDDSWPPLCRATVTVPVAGKTFTGQWMRGQRDAQIETCRLVSAFLDAGDWNDKDSFRGKASKFSCQASDS